MAKNIQKEIADLQAGIDSPATPEAQKVVMRNILAKLKDQVKPKTDEPFFREVGSDGYDSNKHASKGKKEVSENKSKAKMKAKKEASKSTDKGSNANNDQAIYDYLQKNYPRYKDDLLVEDNDGVELSDEEYNSVFFEMVDDLRAKFFNKNNDERDVANDFVERYMSDLPKATTKESKAPTKAEPKKATNTGGYDCDDLIAKETEKAKKRKENASKKANEPKKTEATKNKERIEKVADAVETNLEKRIAKGQVSKSELTKLIAEAESFLSMLKKALSEL